MPRPGPALVLSESEHCRRAAALPPDERRAAVAAATLPLLMQYGSSVTTKQIAEAAGIAEGTIFRAFADKEAVVQAAVELAFDPTPIEQALDRLDCRRPFRVQLTKAVEIVQDSMANIGRLVTAVGAPTVFSGRQRPLPAPRNMMALFERNEGAVRFAPEEASRLLCAMTLALSHPALIGDVPLAPAEIVSMFLDGAGSLLGEDQKPHGSAKGAKQC
jgi:AcrR family transcriptional regulator